MAPDNLSAVLTPVAPLTPNTYYEFNVGTYTDVAGNSGQARYTYFTTGSGAITTAPNVVAVSPANGAASIPLNAMVQATLSAPADATSLSNAVLTLSPAATGTVTLSNNNMTVSLTPSAALSPGTLYTATVSSLKDQQGNLVTPYSWSFTTGSSADASGLTVTSVNPPSNATGVSVNTSIALTFNKTTLNPLTVNIGTFTVVYTAVNAQVAGSFAVSNGVATFTPSTPLPGNTRFSIYESGVTDTEGHSSSFGYSYFTTANVTDATPLTVVSVSPTNGMTNVGRDTQVVVTFNKSINPQTVSSTSVRLFNGDAPLNASTSMSSDNRTLMLNSNTSDLPAGALITVELTSAVQDLSGNALTPFQSQFTVTPAIPTAAPTVVVMRPGNGATGVPVTSNITIFTSVPLDISTFATGVRVADNGVVVTGSVRVLANGQELVFTPDLSFGAGDVIQVFLNSTVTDIYGNAISPYSASFTTAGAPSSVGPKATALSLAYNLSNVPLNAQLQIQFDQPLNPATVKASNISFYNYSVGSQTPTVSLSSNNQLLTITPPGGLLSSGARYQVTLSANITNLSGQATSGAQLYFVAGTASDNSTPTILYVTPPNGATAIGINAPVSVTFNQPIDPVTVTNSTIALTGPGSTPIPASISFNSTYNQAILTPLQALPASATVSITINGVTNEVGNAVTPQASTFTTLNGPDFAAPVVIAGSVGSSQTVGTNAVFSAQFEKPIDPASYLASNVYVQNGSITVPVKVTYSSDLTMIVLTPLSALTPGPSYFYVYGMKDLSGNNQQGYSVSFTVGSGPVTTPLQVLLTNPPASSTLLATNAPIQILFSSPLANGGQAVLSSGGSTVSTTRSYLSGNTVLQLTPSTLLTPSASYTLSVSGLQDITGNPLTAPYSLSFNTAPSIDLTAPTTVSVSPSSGATNVPDNTAIVAVFSKAIDPVSVNSNSFRLIQSGASLPVAGIYSFSANYKTVTFTPSAALAGGGATYSVYLNYNANVTDQAGNNVSSSTVYSFTTQ